MAGNNIFKIYRNDDATLIEAQNLSGVYEASLAWGDYENDGDLDIVITGRRNVTMISEIYRNDNGTFVLDQSVSGARSGDSAWGDYDNDGDLDLAITGGHNGYWYCVLYRNDNGTFSEDQKLFQTMTGSVAWGDYNNDGYLDLVVVGLASGGIMFNRFYRNDNGTLIEDVTRAGNGEDAVWGDYDNDGDIDVVIAGLTNYAADVFAVTVYKNNEAEFKNINSTSTAPSNSSFDYKFVGDKLVLTWGNGSDTETPVNGLYYNFRAGTVSGSNDVATGKYGTPLLGNYLRPKISPTTLGINLRNIPKNTTYYWSIQTIDAGLRASNWSTEQTTPYFVEESTVTINGNPELVFTCDDSQVYSEIVDTTTVPGSVVITTAALAGVTLVSNFYDIKPDGITLDPPGSLIIRYSTTVLAGLGITTDAEEKEKLKIYRYFAGEFTAITGPDDVDAVNNLISTTITELSIFGIFAPIPFICADINVDPDTLNLKSKGRFITAYFELSFGLGPEFIDVTSLKISRINDVEISPIYVQSRPTEIGDKDSDGIKDLMVKFDRASVHAVLTPAPAVSITIEGALKNAFPLIGWDTIRVIRPPEDKPSDFSSKELASKPKVHPKGKAKKDKPNLTDLRKAKTKWLDNPFKKNKGLAKGKDKDPFKKAKWLEWPGKGESLTKAINKQGKEYKRPKILWFYTLITDGETGELLWDSRNGKASGWLSRGNRGDKGKGYKRGRDKENKNNRKDKMGYKKKTPPGQEKKSEHKKKTHGQDKRKRNQNNKKEKNGQGNRGRGRNR